MVHGELSRDHLASRVAGGSISAYGHLDLAETYHGQIVSRVNEICDSYDIVMNGIQIKGFVTRFPVLISTLWNHRSLPALKYRSTAAYKDKSMCKRPSPDALTTNNR